MCTNVCLWESYVQQSGPFQCVVHGVPQTHLSVLSTAEEQVLERVGGQTPQLICVSLTESSMFDNHWLFVCIWEIKIIENCVCVGGCLLPYAYWYTLKNKGS